jgi:cysteine desulfurase / selenocysteine lyase
MKKPTIYFDNAATSHPKPEEVYRAADSFLRAGGSPGRSAHELSVMASRRVFEARMKIAGFLGIKSPERLIFTPGCTQSINMVLNGIAFRKGDRVLVSSLEHNAVMRCLHKLKSEKCIEIIRLPYFPGQIFSEIELENQLKNARPALCVFLEASNVTGEVLDLSNVSRLCSLYETPLLVDAAQSAGVVQTRLDNLALTYWCASGHKGLFGVPGIGLLFVHPEADIAPLVYGGTGSHSQELSMPAVYPDRLEPGTMSGPAIAGLAAGVEFLERTGPDKIMAHEMDLCRSFLEWLKAQPDYRVVGTKARHRAPLVSFSIKGMDSNRVAELLDRDCGICVRSGLHCSASAHESLGTLESGLVRVSFSYFNTQKEVTTLCKALGHIASIRA